MTALSISFSLIPFKATLFSCPKSIFHRCANFTEVREEVSVSQAVSGQVSLPLIRSLLLLSSSFIALKEKRNKRTNEQTDRKVIKLSHRISRTISAPPRALLWSTPASSDSPLLTFRTILGGNFSPLPSVWTFDTGESATRAPLWDLRTLSTSYSFFFLLLFNERRTNPGAVIVCCYTERARVLRCVWSLLCCCCVSVLRLLVTRGKKVKKIFRRCCCFFLAADPPLEKNSQKRDPQKPEKKLKKEKKNERVHRSALENLHNRYA